MKQFEFFDFSNKSLIHQFDVSEINIYKKWLDNIFSTNCRHSQLDDEIRYLKREEEPLSIFDIKNYFIENRLSTKYHLVPNVYVQINDIVLNNRIKHLLISKFNKIHEITKQNYPNFPFKYAFISKKILECYSKDDNKELINLFDSMYSCDPHEDFLFHKIKILI